MLSSAVIIGQQNVCPSVERKWSVLVKASKNKADPATDEVSVEN